MKNLTHNGRLESPQQRAARRRRRVHQDRRPARGAGYDRMHSQDLSWRWDDLLQELGQRHRIVLSGDNEKWRDATAQRLTYRPPADVQVRRVEHVRRRRVDEMRWCVERSAAEQRRVERRVTQLVIQFIPR